VKSQLRCDDAEAILKTTIRADASRTRSYSNGVGCSAGGLNGALHRLSQIRR
jgi:hypothetical protein